MADKKLIIDGSSLTLEKINFFLLENPTVSLSNESKKKVIKARKLINKWVDEGEIIYGVTTGFGEFANVSISKKDIEKLQENLIISHSTGVGEPLPPFIVKIMMLLRVNALASGHSGIRLETLELLIAMINNNIIPVIPSQGSVGSSGDLAPLSHLVLAMIGKGEAQIYQDVIKDNPHKIRVLKSTAALKKFGLTPIKLAAKEGLALINGTQMMTAFAAYICIEAKKLEKIADISGALSHETLRGTDNAFDLRLHKLRPFPGQIAVAKNILAMIKGSEIRESHRENDPRVQDSYSLRCIPQIHGASRDSIDYVCSRVEIELNSVNDNPLIFPDDEAHLEGGNFHGQPIALAMDFMAIALSEYANVSERRTERMLNGSLSNLPRFLSKNGGLNSGLMIVQYTAAALVSENKVLAHPASVDSIPTSANQEDHNSMGSIAARKCFQILNNVQAVLAIEILTACQGMEFHKPLKPGTGSSIAYKIVRKSVPALENDRIIYKDIERVKEMILNNNLLDELSIKIDIK
ncbi:MAG: histidine ammonia-lyase [Ignavibacteriaceae bacterium]|nr:histidine ammonia-lyase [Ignavibacteriaceae bacterium]HRN25839.1 histidine ammonia-lyase [Ignavibacteriaceae bacterium]HRP91434.1 histidine ammonia-lyase [Ignavibacteriaceae bacterium]HRQ53453.1 histidine ammonia-lyase [Ignavibacteriaceae bacterium]